MTTKKNKAAEPGLLDRIHPGFFGAPLGLLASSRVLDQVAVMEGSPFDRFADWVLVAGLGVLGLLVAFWAARLSVREGAISADFSTLAHVTTGATLGMAVTLAGSGLAANGWPMARELMLAGAGFSLLSAVLAVRLWFIRPVESGDISPTWFIPVAGTLVAAKALGDAGGTISALLMCGLGFFGWLMVLPIIARRLIVDSPMPEEARPSLGILIAPPALVASALLSLLPGSASLALALAALGMGVFLLLVLLSLYRQFEKAPFSAAWWGVTFPTAALASAALTLASVTGHSGLTLMAHGLAGLNIVLTTGVAVLAVRHLHQIGLLRKKSQ